jgi:sugar phosphate isomerase/epimerase
MNLAVSNFAWDFDNIDHVGKILNKNNINHIELVFSKYKDWSELNGTEIHNLKELLTKHNLSCLSSQSLFFNIDCKSIVTESEKFVNHFKTLISYSKILGIKTLVFGSPSLRKTNDIIYSNLHETFKKIDLLLDGTEIILCIEPNSKVYGGEFFYTIEEIVVFLKTFNFKNIFTMCDTHNSWLENKDPNKELVEFFPYIKHIHISEPKLDVINDVEKHKTFSNTIKECGYNKLITYEVLLSENTLKSVNTFSEIYTFPFKDK